MSKPRGPRMMPGEHAHTWMLTQFHLLLLSPEGSAGLSDRCDFESQPCVCLTVCPGLAHFTHL